MDTDTRSADDKLAAYVQERMHPQPTVPAPNVLSQFRHVTEVHDAAPVLNSIG